MAVLIFLIFVEVVDLVFHIKYNLGQIELRAYALNSSWSYIEITLNIGVYLNTKQYYMDSALTTSLYTLMNETEIELDSKDITIIVYNKATELTVSSDVKAQAGQNVPIEVKLTTGYVYDDGDDNNDGDKIGSVKFEDCSVVGNSANKLLLDIQGKDKVDLVLTTSNKMPKIYLIKQDKIQMIHNLQFGICLI